MLRNVIIFIILGRNVEVVLDIGIGVDQFDLSFCSNNRSYIEVFIIKGIPLSRRASVADSKSEM